MSDQREAPQLPEDEPRSPRSRFLFPIIALIVLAVVVGFLWRMGNQLQKMEHRLGQAEQRAAAATEKMLQYAGDLEEARAKTSRALQEASQAKEEADAEAAARLQAEHEAERRQREAEIARAHAEQALEQTQQAHAQTQQARAETEQAREELTQIRQRRERELKRMQEALNQIAPTRRTPTGMIMELSDESFRFDFDSAALRPRNRETLSRIAGVLLASEGYRLFIDGHTDDVGTVEYNLNLSKRRAKSVRDYLVEAGVPADIITTQGFGKANPRAKGTSREARQQNRRVEIGIVDTIIDYKGVVDTAEKK